MNEPSEIYKLLFDSAGEGMVVTNERGEIELLNDRLLKMFDYKREELVGKPIEILVPDAAKKRHQTHKKTYMQHPKKRRMGGDMDLSARKKDGSEFSVEIGLNHCRIDNKLKVVAIITDITERVLSQDKLRNLNTELEEKVKLRTLELEKSQKLYNLIACNFPRGIINVFNKQLNYVFVEGQELDKLGLTSQRLIGKSYTSRFGEKKSEFFKSKFESVFDGAGISFEFEDKNNFYVVNAVPLKSPNTNIEQILVIEKNITDSKIAQREMAKNLEKERQLNELKSRFVSMASHEFRTPLSTILSSATLAEKYTQSDQQENRLRHLDRIKSSVKNLTSILNDFLSIDKLEDGKIEIHPTEFLIEELVQEAIEELGVYLKKNQHITFDSNNNSAIQIYSDRNVIKNVLINLLSNASKYSDEGDEIKVYLKDKDKGFQIDISDQGIGIPAEEQAQLFNRFFRAKNVTNIGGTGLGLNIVKKYLSLLNGDIFFKSEENIGTTFSIIIPNSIAS